MLSDRVFIDLTNKDAATEAEEMMVTGMDAEQFHQISSQIVSISQILEHQPIVPQKPNNIHIPLFELEDQPSSRQAVSIYSGDHFLNPNPLKLVFNEEGAPWDVLKHLQKIEIRCFLCNATSGISIKQLLTTIIKSNFDSIELKIPLTKLKTYSTMYFIKFDLIISMDTCPTFLETFNTRRFSIVKTEQTRVLTPPILKDIKDFTVRAGEQVWIKGSNFAEGLQILFDGIPGRIDEFYKTFVVVTVPDLETTSDETNDLRKVIKVEAVNTYASGATANCQHYLEIEYILKE